MSDAHTDFEGITGWDEDEAREVIVDDDRCAWCKWPRDQWADDVEAHEIDTDEIICSNCLGDMRRYKRTVVIDLYRPRHWIEDDTDEAISEQYEHLLEVADLPESTSRTSNATGFERYNDEQ